MPAPIDLKTIPHDTLDILRLDKKKSTETGRRYWLVKCRLCDRTTSIPGANIRSGSAKSCGCLRKKAIKRLAHKRFTGGRITKAFHEHDRVTRVGRIYLRTGKAMAFLGISKPSLRKWADKDEGCPWLNGKAIRSITEHITAFGEREFNYYLDDDLIAVRDAMCTRNLDHPGFMLVEDALKGLGVSKNTLVNAAGKQTPPVMIVRKPAKMKDGRACNRAYVPAPFFEYLKAKQRERETAPGKVTVSEAANQLDVSTTTVRTYVRDGRLSGRFERRATGLTKHSREEIIIAQESIDLLKRMLRGEREQVSTVPRAEPVTHQKAEMLPTASRKAGRIQDPKVAELYAFCWQHYRVEMKKAVVVMSLANQTFKGLPIKEENYVRIYAARHEKSLQNKG